MKWIPNITLILILSLCTLSTQANDSHLIERYTQDGQKIKVQVLLVGKICYYKRELASLALPFEEAYPDYSQTRAEYYIANGREGALIPVKARNYVEILKPMLIGHPRLFRNLGRKGYTFQELFHIIDAYNRKQKGLA